MKSVKPGRGPSMMGFIVSIFAALFGIFWCVIAVNIGAGFMAIFGIVFIGIAIAQAVYNYRNATGENRYSAFDITEDGEEPDPFTERFRQYRQESRPPRSSHPADPDPISYGQTGQPSAGQKSRFCPYCGTPADPDYQFCKNCGKHLPD